MYTTFVKIGIVIQKLWGENRPSSFPTARNLLKIMAVRDDPVNHILPFAALTTDVIFSPGT